LSLFHAPCSPGLESVLADELAELGGDHLVPSVGGVSFQGDLLTAYRVCLWSRIALRVYEPLAEGPVSSADDLYNLARTVRWSDYLRPSTTFAVFATGTAPGIEHTKFAALRVKDAVCDALRDQTGARPDVDTLHPDLPLKVALRHGVATISRDFAGAPLYRRGWRPVQVKSPMNEALAAGLLRLTGWRGDTPLLDPMCGSGTLCIEAAHLAGDRAPGLERPFAFERWADARLDSWQGMLKAAHERARVGKRNIPSIVGSDRHPGAIEIANASAARAGVDGAVRFVQRDVAELHPDPKPGVVVCNPPYGVRIGEGDDLLRSWRELGAFLKRECAGSRAWVLSGDKLLNQHLKLKADQQHPVRNTSIECRWLGYELLPR